MMKSRWRNSSGHKSHNGNNNNEESQHSSNKAPPSISEDLSDTDSESDAASTTDTQSQSDCYNSKSGLWIPNLPGVDFYFLVASMALYCYMNALTGEMVHDDILAIQNNKDVLPSTPISKVFINDFWGRLMSDPKSHKSYRPFTTLTFRINYLWSEFDTYSYHLVNVLLHMFVSLLYTYVCSAIVFKDGLPAYLAGVLFAVHPIHTEAVSNIVGRADILACLFFLLAFMSYTKCISEKRKEWGFARTASFPRLAQALFLGAVAILFKEHGATVFGVFLIYDVFVACRKGLSKIFFNKFSGHVLEPTMNRCAIVCMGATFVLCFRLQMLQGELPRFSEQDNPAAHSPFFFTRVLTYCYLAAFNVYLLICPTTLSYDWQVGSIPLVESLWDRRNLATLTVFTTLILLLRHAWKAKNKEQRVLVIGLAFLIIPFLPASNIIITVGFVVAERILYIPSMGFCILLAHGISKLCLTTGKRFAKVITIFAVLLATLYTVKTITRNMDWHNREKLFRSGLETLPHNAKMHYNWANYMKDTGKTTDAIKHYEICLELYPNHTSAYNNLGTLVSEKDPSQAEQLFSRAMESDPTHPRAHFNMANMLIKRGENKKAREMYQTAIRLEPEYVDPYTNLAYLCEREDKILQAEELYRHAMTLVPDGPDECSNYGAFLARTGKHHMALEHYQACLSHHRDHTTTIVNAARLLRHMGRTQESECYYKRALKIKKDPDTLQKLGALYYNTNRTSLAKLVYEDAIALDDKNIELQMQYAQILVQMNELNRAISWLATRVLKKYPRHVAVHRQVASIYSMQSRFQEALNFNKKALSLVPESDNEMKGQVYFEKGNIYRELEQNDSAIESYQRAVRLHPKLGSAHMNLAAMWHIQGNYRLAKQHYTIALRYDPENRMLIENIAKISRLEYNATKQEEHTDEVNTGEMYELLVSSFDQKKSCPNQASIKMVRDSSSGGQCQNNNNQRNYNSKCCAAACTANASGRIK